MFHLEDGSTIYLREVASYLPLKMAKHHRRLESSSTLIRDPPMSRIWLWSPDYKFIKV